MGSIDTVLVDLQQIREFADNILHPLLSPENWGTYSELCDMIENAQGYADGAKTEYDNLSEILENYRRESKETLSVQELEDLDTIRRVRSGQVKKHVCHDYAIYNGDWYRQHPWNIPKEKEEPLLLTMEELMQVNPGTVLWDDIRDKQEDGPKDENEWIPLHPVCFYGFDKIEIEPGKGKEDVILFPLGFDRLRDYGKTFALWTERPTDQQRREARWG